MVLLSASHRMSLRRNITTQQQQPQQDEVVEVEEHHPQHHDADCSTACTATSRTPIMNSSRRLRCRSLFQMKAESSLAGSESERRPPASVNSSRSSMRRRFSLFSLGTSSNVNVDTDRNTSIKQRRDLQRLLQLRLSAPATLMNNLQSRSSDTEDGTTNTAAGGTHTGTGTGTGTGSASAISKKQQHRSSRRLMQNTHIFSMQRQASSSPSASLSASDETATETAPSSRNNNNNNAGDSSSAVAIAVHTNSSSTGGNNTAPNSSNRLALLANNIQREEATTTTTTPMMVNSCGSATAILLCGIGGGGGGAGRTITNDILLQEEEYNEERWPRNTNTTTRQRLPDDPTVQESIECIFASQLEEGLSLFGEEDDDVYYSDNDDNDHDKTDDEEEDYHLQPLVAPSVLQQSILKNRSGGRNLHSNYNHHRTSSSSSRQRRSSSSSSQRRKQQQTEEISKARFELVGGGPYDDSHALETKVSPSVAAAASAAVAAAAASSTGGVGVEGGTGTIIRSGNNCACRRLRHSHSLLPFPQAPPLLEPKDWPQRPLLMRPSRGTRVIGVRFSSSPPGEYLWKPPCSSSISSCHPEYSTSDNHHHDNVSSTWLSALKRHWGQKEDPHDPILRATANMPSCPQCCILPVNNGNEPEGEALVTDFETTLFHGTILVRLRHSQGTTPEPYNDAVGYFAGMNRRYQAVVRGHFKESVPFTECHTGFQLDRPVGKLPPKWIVKSTLKVVSFFAPQLDVDLDGAHPSSLTPLGSTPQCIVVSDVSAARGDKKDALTRLDGKHEEPINAENTLLGQAAAASTAAAAATTSLQRARFRKRHFDKLFTAHSKHPRAQAGSNKIYTFEFLQHLFDFEKLSIELGSVLGSLSLHEILKGQPLQIMALRKPHRNHGSNDDEDDDDDNSSNEDCRYLWAFDIWHEVVMQDAKKIDE